LSEIRASGRKRSFTRERRMFHEVRFVDPRVERMGTSLGMAGGSLADRSHPRARLWIVLRLLG